MNPEYIQAAKNALKKRLHLLDDAKQRKIHTPEEYENLRKRTIQELNESWNLKLEDQMFDNLREEPRRPIFADGRFSWFFSIAKEWEKTSTFKGIISNYCTIRGASEIITLEVKPVVWVEKWIKENMIGLPRTGPITFEIIIHHDNTASILAQYSRIIGNRLLAYIDVNTIPLFGRTIHEPQD